MMPVHQIVATLIDNNERVGKHLPLNCQLLVAKFLTPSGRPQNKSPGEAGAFSQKDAMLNATICPR
jgi:hypothetical protein